MATERSERRLDAIATASGERRLAGQARTVSDVSGAAGQSGNPTPRKRGKNVHDRQVLADFFSADTDAPRNERAPTELISRMGVGSRAQPGDFYDDVYAIDGLAKKQSSFGDMSVERQEALLESLQAAAPKAISRSIQAPTGEMDPTAIFVPQDHRHDLLAVPTDGDCGDPHALVREAHLPEMCGLHGYDALEDAMLQMDLGGLPQQMPLRDLVRTVSACTTHGMQPISGGALLVVELEERGVFCAAIELSSTTVLIGGGDIVDDDAYIQWTGAIPPETLDAVVVVVGRWYFTCPCVASKSPA